MSKEMAKGQETETRRHHDGRQSDQHGIREERIICFESNIVERRRFRRRSKTERYAPASRRARLASDIE